MIDQQLMIQRERLHEYFRRHGLEGEDSFRAIAYHYSRLFPLQMSNLPTSLLDTWNRAYHKIEHDPNIEYYLNKIISDDRHGDHLPDWYGFFVGRKFREGSGKFFTPTPIAKAMVNLLPLIDSPVIMDPTCGGGTFLMEAARRWQNNCCTLVANDLEKSLVELAMAALSLASQPKNRCFYSNANIFDATAEMASWYGQVDYILANPPFSLRIEHEQFESPLFRLGYRNSDALFVDTAYQLLKPGGRLVCLLPHSIVANHEFVALRKAVEERWQVVAVLCLPEGIFHLNAGTTARADILVLDKKPLSRSSYKRIFASITSVGARLNGQSKNIVSDDLTRFVNDEDVKQTLGTN